VISIPVHKVKMLKTNTGYEIESTDL